MKSPAVLPAKRTRRQVGVAACVAAIVLGASNASATPDEPLALVQSADTTGRRITLDEAIALAERHNPAYRRATNSLGLDRIEQREAWLDLLPRPQLTTLATSVSWNLQHVGTDPFGNPLPNPEAQTVQSSQSRQQALLGFSFNVADYVRFRNRGLNAATRQVSVAHQRHDLHTDIGRAFLTVQQEQVAVELEEALLERQVRNRETARQLYALAQRERIDLLEADLNVAVQEDQLRQSRAVLSTALLELRNRVGDASLELAGVVPVPFRSLDPATLDDDALVRVALGSNPTIELQQAEIRRIDAIASESRWQQWMPNLTLGLSTSRTELARNSGDAFMRPNPSALWDRNFTIGLSFPDLARYFDHSNQHAGRKIAMQDAQELLRERRLQVEQAVRTTLVELRRAHASVELQERRLGLAQERLANRLGAYRLGRGDFQDLQNATDAVADAERALHTARYQLEYAVISLERALVMPFDQIVLLGMR